MIAATLAAAGSLNAALPTPAAAPYKQWGLETLAQIDKDFRGGGDKLYREKFTNGKEKSGPAFMWGCGVMLSALTTAAKIDPDKYTPKMNSYIRALDAYWQPGDGLGGYDVLPVPKGLDRYYDDNAWIVLDLIEAYKVTGAQKNLKQAEETLNFVMSGEDQELGGGLYWREHEKKSKNTCTNAPAIVALLELHQVTKNPKYFDDGLRIYRWTNSKLQQPDGLYGDNVTLDGHVNGGRLTYNSGLMIRANVELYRITKEQRYLDEAKRIAESAMRVWFKPDGGVDNEGKFAHLLVGGLCKLYEVDRDPKLKSAIEKALKFVHDRLKDAKGRYSAVWDKPPTGNIEEADLLSQASVARAFLEAAITFGRP